MAKYANYQKVCDCVFAIFTILWIGTRMGVYPFWIIHRYALLQLIFINYRLSSLRCRLIRI